MKHLNFPQTIDYLVCSDFDETYFAHDLANAEDVKALDDYIAATDNVLFGIVSASTIEMIEDCLAKGHFKYRPHFISSNSGTELRFYQQGTAQYDEAYEQQLLDQGFTKSTIMEVEAQLAEEGIPLTVQLPFADAPFSRNYYYQESDQQTDEWHFKRIRELAAARSLIVNISKCNPLIGDPADHYDVDFFPATAGKDAVVHYLINKYNISHDNTCAFGDSGNDIKMLNAVKHGYLVSNATPEAKKLFSQVTDEPYSRGILTTLARVIK